MRTALRSLVPLILLALAATGLATHARAGERVPGELIVGYRAGTRAAERAALRSSHRAVVLHRFRTIDAEWLKVEGDLDAAIAALAADPRVAYAEPNAIFHANAVPNDPRFAEQWSLRNTGQTGGAAGADVDAVAAWDVSTGNPQLRIGVIDSGIDIDHPDLIENLWTNPGEIPGNQLDDDGNGYVDDVHGYDFANHDPNPDDDNRHGTHVAGILAAQANNGIGIAGLAWSAQLVAIKFLDSSGSGSTAGAIEAVEYANALGLRVTNNSWGGGEFSQALHDAIAAAGAIGQVFVAAAGNRAENNDAVAHYPSNYDLPNIVAVAATGATDALAPFSSYGAASVDLAAPGVSILSCLPGGTYGLASGTSMAAPLVAGTVALLMGRSPELTPAQAIALLMRGVEPVPALEGLVASGGRLNTLRAIADPDTIAPGPVTALNALDPGSNSVLLEWVATGDDGDMGRAADYDIRFAPFPIDAGSLDDATRVPGPAPAAAGASERFEVGGLEPNTGYWFVVRAVDDFGNSGPLAASATATTLGPPRIFVLPPVVLTSLAVGARDTVRLTIENAGEGTLDFTVPAVTLAFPPEAALERATFDASLKGAEGAPGPPVAAFAGGPDAMGYRWIDSRETGGPEFDWIDVTGDGARVPLTGDDALSGPIDIGFEFPFYGSNVRTVRFSTNGLLTFSDAEAAPVNQPLPSPGAPPLAVAPFWDDLLFASVERAWYRADPDRFIATWLAVPHYGSGGPYTFQAVLYANGEIRFQYRSMTAATLSATAGLQNGDRSVGLTVAHNTVFFTDSLAVRIVPLPQWASATPPSGRVRAGERMDLHLALDARGLLGGAYDATLSIQSNDPLNPEHRIPVRLIATGAPDLVLEPPALAFGDVFVGAAATRALRVSNPGTEWLHLGAIETGDSAVEVDASWFSVPPRGSRTIGVTFRPTEAGTLAASLRIHSNVAGGSVTSVPVAGRGLAPPVIAHSPAALRVLLVPYEQATPSIRFENQGAAALIVTARATAAAPGVAPARAWPAAAREPRAKRAADVDAASSAPVLRGAAAPAPGGPDAFGYTYRTSDDPDGPEFEWIEAAGAGTPLPLRGDDVTTAPLALGFDFPFYGGTRREVRVCTNGWLSFTSGLTAFSNTVLPSAAPGVPENLVAPYWDDFHFAEVRNAWILHTSGRAVIQWNEVGRLDDAARPNTFQVVLHADGRIRFQYLRMKGENLRSGTAGIQNAARDDGLTIAYNTVFARDSLAIEIAPPARWFEVHPASATVAPGGSLALEVRVHPQGRYAGVYAGAIALTSNDPLRAAFAVPCTLEVVGAPRLVIDQPEIAIEPAYAGFARTIEAVVRNEGTAAFDLALLSAGHPALSASLTPSRIEADGTARLRVTLGPSNEGAITSSLTLQPDTGAPVVFPVRASVIAAPRAALSAPRIEATLANGLGPVAETRGHDVVIVNEGGSPLDWSADVLLSGLPVTRPSGALSASIPRPKGTAAPAGRVGAPGPDAGGYHWADSRAAGAPAFEWIDIDMTGTSVPLDADDQITAAIALPFEFPFYGGTFGAVRIGSNGYLSFTDGAIQYVNVPLPAASAPRNLVAPFWTDLDFRAIAGSGRARAAHVGGRFVVSFLDVPRFGGGAPSSFQVILSPDGAIDFQYLHAGAGADQATVGIQNGRGDTGLLVVSSATFIEDGMRISIRRRAAWLSIEPSSGTIAAGGRDTLRVLLRALEHEDGVYSGAVRLHTGDPAQPDRTLAAAMRVGRIPAMVRLDAGRGGSGTPRWIEAHVRAGEGIEPAAVAPSRPWIAGVRAVDAGTVLEDGVVVFRFPRLDVLRRGAGAALQLAGAIEGVGWMFGDGALRDNGPAAAVATLPTLRGGERTTLTWLPAPGVRVDVHQSLDDGATWTPLARGIEDGAGDYTAPRTPAGAAWLELEAIDAAGHAGSSFIGPFEILAGDPLPERMALAVRGTHPARAPIAFELALPEDRAVRIDVFDLRGARIATLAEGRFTAGRHRIEWDGADRAGRALSPGVYFARALAGSQEARARIVLVR
jgi:subtilisin family serine protease